MTAVSYVPGTWLGVVRSHTAVLLDPDTKPALIAALWDLLESRPEVHEVLHAVTSSSGGSLANIPSFGILDFQGPLRVFLRGDLDVTVQSADGPVELNGRDVTTWTERRLNQSGTCRLAIPAAGPSLHPQSVPVPAHADPSELPDLPLGEGVVLLQSLVLTAEAATSAARPAPAAVEPAVAAGTPVAAGTAVAAPPAADASPPVIETSAAEAPTYAVPAPVIEASKEADLPEITVAPEHEASAETVYAVIDEDFDDDGLAETDAAPEPGADPDPEAVREDDGGAATEAGLSASREDATSTASGQAPASEMTSSYDHLWERTVVRRIEDAAVREEPEPDGPEPSGQATADQETAGQATGLQEAAHQEATDPAASGQEAANQRNAASPAESGSGQGSPATADAPPAVVPEAPSAGSAALAPGRPAASGLIDSVPWRTPAGDSEPAPPPAVPAPMLSAIPSAASAATVAPEPEANHAEYDADHDGQTVMKGSLKGMAAQPVRTVADASTAAGPLVLARLCPQDHANPPTSATCAACGAGLLPDAVQVARPRLGRMRISTGELVDLDQSLVIGRQPSVSRVQGGVMPRLVQVASPGGDISRSHVEVRLEGWHVMLCDLKATNGTVLVREGQPPRRLAQNEMAILLDGDIAELGDNISLRFEEIL